MNKNTFLLGGWFIALIFILWLLAGSCKTCNCPAYTSRKLPPGSQLEQPAGFHPELYSPGSSVAEHEQALSVQEKMSTPEVIP